MNGQENSVHLTIVAKILNELSGEIEELGAALCGDPALAERHMTALQAIDLIAQKQRWLAEWLRADCSTSAANAIGIETLKQRLHADSKVR